MKQPTLEEVHRTYLSDVPLEQCCRMVLGKPLAETRAEQEAVARRIRREAETRLISRQCQVEVLEAQKTPAELEAEAAELLR